MQLTLADLKGRIARLERLAPGLAWEVDRQRGAADLLLFRERKQTVKRRTRCRPTLRRIFLTWFVALVRAGPVSENVRELVDFHGKTG
jgi:hypothetical protein